MDAGEKGTEKMTFEELWKQVEGLPEMAKIQVPRVLSESTKKKLARKKPEEVRQIVVAAIDEVNNGSVEPLDRIIRKKI